MSFNRFLIEGKTTHLSMHPNKREQHALHNQKNVTSRKDAYYLSLNIES